MAFVIDASATMPWCFKDEATEGTERLLDRAALDERIYVPAHWPTEVSNTLLMASRRKRIAADRSDWFWDKLSALKISVEMPLSPAQAKTILNVAERYHLTFYDATYLDLAQRLELPLATLDSELIAAAHLTGVDLILLG
jgi:predicted nucleic acid-binding protein